MKVNVVSAITLAYRRSRTRRWSLTSRLKIAEGSFVTLFSPSGSGKSTILQMIGGFVARTSGRILFGADDVLPP